MQKIVTLFVLLVSSNLVLPVFDPANAAGGSAVPIDSAPIDHYDFGSKQRGAQLYVNYCIGCHSMKYMRYTRVAEDLGIEDDLMTENISFGGKLFAPMESAMNEEVAKNWFNQARPPDLSLTARSRGADWLYTYLRSFYRDPHRPSGWNNLVFENVAMPNVLHKLQGSYYFDDDGNKVEITAASMSELEFNRAVADLVNFLVYVGEPARNTRVAIGYGVMIFLSFLLVIVYSMYREYWVNIK